MTTVALAALCGMACGCASALFLVLLDAATHVREQTAWLPFALPAAGFVIGALYTRFGAPIRGGTNLVLQAIHDGEPRLPRRMAPLVLSGTVLTHLFGGSAGREGTAVQMGASLSESIASFFGCDPMLRRQLLFAGVAGGFGSVFGTPVAGAIFAMEFITRGRFAFAAILPSLVAACVGDVVTRALGVTHATYASPSALPLTPLLVAKWVLFAIAVSVVTLAFLEALHHIKHVLSTRVPHLALRMAVGGTIVVLMWVVARTDMFLGLGVPTIQRAFLDENLAPWAFAAKLLFTAVTVGSGFLGGEVTPLFFIGAALGNALAHVLQLPLAMAAGVGMAAVFGAAARAPIALSVMAVELLGVQVLPHVVIVCVVANMCMGQRSLYAAQR